MRNPLLILRTMLIVLSIVASGNAAKRVVQPLDSLVAHADIIVIGRVVEKKETNMSIIQLGYDFGKAWEFTIEIDTTLKGDTNVTQVIIGDLPELNTCIDTVTGKSCVYFIALNRNKNSRIKYYLDYIVNRQFCINGGKVVPSYVKNEDYRQSLRDFIDKISAVIRCE